MLAHHRSSKSAFTTIARSMNTTNSSSTAHSASQHNREDRLWCGPVTDKAKRAKHSQSWHQARGPTGITLQVQCWSARHSLGFLNKWAAEYCCWTRWPTVVRCPLSPTCPHSLMSMHRPTHGHYAYMSAESYSYCGVLSLEFWSWKKWS